MKISVVVALVLSFIALSQAIVNLDVQRDIDLTTQLAKHNITIKFSNNENNAVSEYLLAIPTRNDLWYISAVEIKADGTTGNTLEVIKGDTATPAGYVTYKVKLAQPVAAGAQATIRVTAVFVDALKAFPTHIKQGDKQLVRYFDNHFFLSPYNTKTQKTTVKLNTPTIESNSEERPTFVNRDVITYGPYEDVPPFKSSELRVHFVSNAPFLAVEHLRRDFEVSHWGNLAIEEDFSELRNVGAEFQGSFSRFDYQRNPGSLAFGVTQLVEVLPEEARDVYYRDDIGNISTSTFKSSAKGLEFVITPRFPLFGGWKNSFYLGYNVPLSSRLFVTEEGRYQLKAPFAVDIDDLIIKRLTIRVVLPEGAKNIEVKSPFSLDSQTFETHYTYLDTAGRPVVVLEKTNLVTPYHNQEFEITYKFTTTALLQEPMLLAGAFFFLFILGMAYARFEFTIEKKVAVVDENAGQLEDLLARYRDVADQRNETHKGVEATLRKLKSASNVQDELVNYSAVVSGQNNKARQLIADIERINPETGSKARELEAVEAKRHIARQQLFNNELVFKNKTIDKDAYEQNKKGAEQAFNKHTREFDATFSSLL